jgi:hypothetical protein
MTLLPYLNVATVLPEADVLAMRGEALSIPRRGFERRVDPAELAQVEKLLGYTRDFPMRADTQVSYFVAEWHGKPCAFFTWATIEHVFAEGDHE